MFKNQRIRDVARATLIRNMHGERIVLAFNKQAAFSGVASFSEARGESPLGPIWLEIEAEDPNDVIDWVAPPRVRK